MSEASFDSRINVGATLAHSARLAMRQWPLGIIAGVLMIGMFWLLLDAAGWTTDGGHAAWMGKVALALPRGQSKALVGDVMTVLPLVVAFIACVGMLRLFYLAEHAATGQLESRQELRFGRFARRTALAWIIVASPIFLDCLYFHIGWMLYPQYVRPIVLSVSYYCVKVVVISFASYLRSRLVLYIPATAYQKRPLSLRMSWVSTYSLRWRLFFVFWLIDLMFAVSQFLFNSLAPKLLDFGPLAQELADRSHLNVLNVAALVPAIMIYSALAPFAGLWAAGVSIIAYREIVTLDDVHARVFD